MKYNSIGEQLIAKAKELDPSYKPDKFNDMSEAIDILLNNSGGALLDITQYLHEGSISQEGYDLIQEKITRGEIIGVFTVDMPYLFMCSQYIIENDDFAGLAFDTPTIGGDVKVRLTIKQDLSLTIEQITNGSSDSSKVWYELPNLFFLENITQEQFDEIKNLALQNQLAGINCGGFYCPLTFYQDEQSISFFFPWYENDIFIPHLIRLDTDLSVKKIPYSTITLPQTAPTSQVIPSITTSNAQQNLTVGDGLVIENGVLKTKDLEMAVSITATLDDLKNAVNSFSIIPYSESNKEEIISFIKNQKGIMKLTITTPVGNLYMTLRPSVWGYDNSPVYDFEGNLLLETDLSAIGGSVVNQIIVRAICWDNTDPVHFRPTIIPIGK